MRRIDGEYLQGQVTRGHITSEEKEMIMATPQVAYKEIYVSQKKRAVTGPFLLKKRGGNLWNM